MKTTEKRIKKNNFLTLSLLVLAFVIGFGVKSALSPANIAVVNLKQVVGQSQKLMLIRQENTVQLDELSKWLDGVEKDINAEKDKTKRKKLAEQYKKIATEKRQLIAQDYNKKIQEIDKEITSLIDEVAAKTGCTVILDKNLVIKGGKDITIDVIKKLNPEQKETN